MFEKEGYSRLFQNFENIIEPKECKLTGTPPQWLKGTMIRNGPGMFEIGDSKYNHWFDGLAYMQRYHFENGKMFYSARFLESESYLENVSKNRIIRSSFGTAALPDPCKTLFARFFSHFVQSEPKHDNANVAFVPVGDQTYACTETPHMYRVDVDTLETKQQVDFSKYVSLHTCTAHQIIDEKGNVFNIGSKFGKNASHVFTITEKSDNDAWGKTRQIGEVKCSDALSPTYMHSFGMSQNYLIMFESPVRINIKKLLMRSLISVSFRDCIFWDGTKDVKVFVINKNTGELHPIVYKMAPFFTFHHANTFEKDGCLVVDYCRIEESGNFDALLIENMKNGTFKNNPRFLPFLSRLVIPLTIPKNAKVGDNLIESLSWTKGCSAILQKDGSVLVKERRACEISLEFPRYHLEKYNMKEYKYCYGSSVLGQRTASELPGIIKADFETGNTLIWKRENEHQICGEPIFVPDPNGVEEDDGILIVPVMTIRDGDNPFVLILDAKTITEVARFKIPEARIPLGFHAFYQSRNGLH